MFHKTSSIEFLEFGEVFSETSSSKHYYRSNHILPVQNKDLIYLYKADQDVYLRCVEGICLLVVTKDLEEEKYHEFVIHRIVKINKGVFFNFISLSRTSKLEMAFPDQALIKTCFFQKEYKYKHIIPKIRINELIAYYYNVRAANYCFEGEIDQFWEFTFVDYGTLYTSIEDENYTVSSNQCIFYAPNQFHKQDTKDSSCSYLTVVADIQIDQKYREQLVNRVFTVDRDTRREIGAFVSFDFKNSSYDHEIMILLMEKIILSLLRGSEEKAHKITSTPMQQKFENEMIEQIILYINENIYSALNVEDLCEKFAISRSSLQSLFRNNIGLSPKEYISNLKLKKSKELIKESKYTISEISAILGFSSIHYFSRRFKQKFGMNPTDYADKIL